MKERPIIFSRPMVQAIYGGNKIQTRRLVNPQPEVDGEWVSWGGLTVHKSSNPRLKYLPFSNQIAFTPYHGEASSRGSKSSFGVPGDRLWVRETWAAHQQYDHHKPSDIPGGEVIWYTPTPRGEIERMEDGGFRGKWRPSIHMPKWAARLWLEVTGVRVQRLQEITEKDAKAEGVGPNLGMGEWVRAFRNLWDNLNKKRAPWSSNPWVWVVEFRKLENSP